MKITFFTNDTQPGWHPDDLDVFLSGNEACLVLLCRELRRRGHTVNVYTTLRAGPEDVLEDFGVLYRQRERFDRDVRYEALVSYKTREPWRWACQADLKIHCSADVEAEWPVALLAQLDAFTHLASFHRDSMPWVPERLRRFMPLALPVEFSVKHKRVEKTPTGMLYCTSPDRGLTTLLQDWGEVCRHYPTPQLLVTYDFRRIFDPQLAQALQVLLRQPGISAQLFKTAQMPEVYGRAMYLVHPLNRKESDLYGYGALQATACGVMPVFPYETLEHTGLQDSVPQWIAYRDFVAGKAEARVNPLVKGDLPRTWSDCVERYWLPLLATGKEVAA